MHIAITTPLDSNKYLILLNMVHTHMGDREVITLKPHHHREREAEQLPTFLKSSHATSTGRPKLGISPSPPEPALDRAGPSLDQD